MKIRYRGIIKGQMAIFAYSDAGNIKGMVFKEGTIATTLCFRVLGHPVDIINLCRTDFLKKPDP